MEPTLVRLIDRYFVALVAILASLEATGEALESLLAGRLAELVAWVCIGLSMITGTYALEIIKSKRGG